MIIVKKNIKIALLLILALACVFESQAQRRKVMYLQNYDKAPYHFGFLIGANFMDYNLILKDDYQSIVYTNFQDLSMQSLSQDNFHCYQITGVERDTTDRLIKSIPRFGISIGVLGDLRLSEYCNLRFTPTFSLSEINYLYTLRINDGEKTITAVSHNPNFCSLEFPIHLKYRSKRYNNVAAYLIAGLSPKVYFTPKKKTQNYNWLKNKSGDLALELGGGFDIYNQWFKMGVEMKFSFGLLNAMSKDQVFFYAHPLNGLRNKQFQISLTFE